MKNLDLHLFRFTFCLAAKKLFVFQKSLMLDRCVLTADSSAPQINIQVPATLQLSINVILHWALMSHFSSLYLCTIAGYLKIDLQT